MITSRSLRVATAVIIAAVLMMPVWVSGAESAEFSLSDAKSGEGRLFELTLSAQGSDNLAAFVAELQFDTEKLEYRSETVCSENAEYSVNTENGKITVAYLCEEGIDCRESESLVTFSFKALSSENSQVSLSVREVVDTDSRDITVFSEKGAAVTIQTGVPSADSGSYSAQGGAVSGDAQGVEATQASSDISDNLQIESDRVQSGSLNIEDDKDNSAIVVSCVLAVMALLCVAVFVAYRVGAESHKRKSEIPVEKNKSDSIETDLK